MSHVDEDALVHVAHDDAGQNNPVERAAVEDLQLDGRRSDVIHGDIGNDDILEAAERFAAETDPAAVAGNHAVGDDDVAADPLPRGFQADGVVLAVDGAVADPHVTQQSMSKPSLL